MDRRTFLALVSSLAFLNGSVLTLDSRDNDSSNTEGPNQRITTAGWECLRCGTISNVEQPPNKLREPDRCSGCLRDGPYRINIDASVLTPV